jgi:Fe-Mn family superoxide dismutase
MVVLEYLPLHFFSISGTRAVDAASVGARAGAPRVSKAQIRNTKPADASAAAIVPATGARGDLTHENRRTKMSDGLERRNFIHGVGLAAGAAAAATLFERSAHAQASTPTGNHPMVYQPKPLSLDPKAIKGISEKVLVSHYENNYVGAVKRLTAISAQLAELDFAKAPNFLVNGLKREELIAANSMILHEVYFDSLGGGGSPAGGLAEAITRDFGSVERWRTEFSAMGKAEGGGSGWVLLAYSPRDKRLMNQWAADHTTTLAGGRPILALDMYEHAYHMDYGAAAARYVDVFMEAIRWDNAVKLYERYSREA